MYLRRVQKQDGFHYIIRETYRDEGSWKHRDLMDLGINPSDYILYPGGNGFYFKPEVEERLDAVGVHYSPDELETVFLPFLKPHIRRIIETFRHDHVSYTLSSACPREQMWQHEHELHRFDKRRVHYLRFGRVEIGNLEGRSWKFLNVLLCKSRDEIESTIETMEQKLRPSEVCQYVFTALHLQSYFTNHLMRNHPAALDPEEVDSHLIEEACRLNQDESFFKGMERHDNGTLHPFLRKYVILFFDHGFDAHTPWNEFMADFIRHRFFRQRPPGPSMETRKAVELLGISEEDFKRMTRRDLVRLYRHRAKKIHPDKGGDHHSFVVLTEAYEALLLRK